MEVHETLIGSLFYGGALLDASYSKMAKTHAEFPTYLYQSGGEMGHALCGRGLGCCLGCLHPMLECLELSPASTSDPASY